MRGPGLIALLASLAIGLPATANAAAEDPAQAVRARAQVSGLSRESAAQLVSAVQAAAATGVPAASVADKVLEGLAKGVAPARIAGAATELTGRLTAARDAYQAAGITLAPGERRALLDRMALAIQSAGRDDVMSLANTSRGATAASLATAARQWGELKVRGAPAAEALPALSALARSGGRGLDRVPALFEEYKAEGGRAPAEFFQEVERRAKSGKDLGGLIDPFAEAADPLRRADLADDAVGERPGKAAAEGKPSLEKSKRAGSLPGLDAETSSRKQKDCKVKGGRAECK